MPQSISTTSARLLARIRRGYVVKTLPIRITDDLCVDFVCVEDPDIVLDQTVIAADKLQFQTGKAVDDDQLHLPYWAELWDSAIGIARWFAANQVDVAGRDLLDLGCGMGLTGTVAAALGYDVTFADLEPPALLFAQLNSLLWAERVREIRRLNWQKDRLSHQFDVIIGADILYERAQWEFLEPFWRAHLNPTGRIILGEPGRQTGDLFVDWIVARGWRLNRHEQKVETRERAIRIFEISLVKPE